MPAEVLQTMPCGCCKGLIALPGDVRVDHDLEAVVCLDCAKQLRGAAAWLKHCGLPQCLKTPPKNRLA